MRRIYFCVAFVAGIWTVSVGDLKPIPIGDQARAIALAKATARELWRDMHVPTSVQVQGADGAWRNAASFGEEPPVA